MKITKIASITLLATVAGASLAHPASALEAAAFVDRVEEVYRHLGYELEFGPATLDGDTVIVDGVTANLVKTPDAEGVSTSAKFTFSGITEREDGSYLVDSLVAPDVDAPISAEPPGNVTLTDIRAEGLYLPAGEPTYADTLQLIKSITTGPLVISREGEKVITMESLEATTDFSPEQGSQDLQEVTAELQLNDVWADLITLNDVVEGGAANMLTESGLSELSGDITQNLTWSLEDGRLTMNEFLVDMRDQGALNITFDLLGLTPELLAQMDPMVADKNGSGSKEQAEAPKSGDTTKSMSLMDDIKLVEASLRYDDAGLVDNLIDFYADKASADRTAYVAWLQAQLANLLVAAGVTPLAEELKPAAENFLSDPQSFVISLNPPNPTTLLTLMGEASNPDGLLSTLGAEIEANTAAATP